MQNHKKHTSFLSTGDLANMSGARHQDVLNLTVLTLKAAGINPEKYMVLRKTLRGNFRAELDLPKKACLVAIGGAYGEELVAEVKRVFKAWRKADKWDRANPIFA